MKVSELIDYVAKDLLDDRKELVSGESDELFSDSLIARHLAEAERILCRRAWVLEDLTTPSATRIQLVEGKTDYALHKSVLFIKAVRLSDSDIDLLRVGYDDNRIGSAVDHGFWDVNFAHTESPGRPTRYSTDMGVRTIRVRQKPDAGSALLKLHLAVVRMPINQISAEDGDKYPEVDEQYHLDLALYAAGKCLNRPSVESELRALGRGWMKDFDDRVQEAKRDRRRFAQSEPRYRFGAWVSDHA